MEALKDEIGRTLRRLLSERYAESPERVAVEYPPQPGMGDLASPIAFEMAKRLRRAPRVIAQELAESFPALPGVARVAAGGAGYLNLFLDRDATTSTRTRRPTSATCGTPFSATRWRAACASSAGRWRCRTTSTTPACRWPTW